MTVTKSKSMSFPPSERKKRSISYKSRKPGRFSSVSNKNNNRNGLLNIFKNRKRTKSNPNPNPVKEMRKNVASAIVSNKHPKKIVKENMEDNIKSSNIFMKFNNFLNNLTQVQFLLLLLVISAACMIMYTGFNKVTETAENMNLNMGIGQNKKNCKDLLNPQCWTEKFFPELEQTDGLTNALLIGLDTRDGEGGMMNTDTIMLASYNHADGKILLISFPRDLYVPYKINGSGQYFSKINAIYANGEMNSNYDDGIDLLKENIEDWFDIDIHFTGKVNFKAVENLVDAVGGVTINLEEDYTDLYPYKELSSELQKDCVRAKDMGLYCVFKFEAGEHELDGEMALIYSRMRQYTSDFDRARRQQEIISAVKNKVLSSDQNMLDRIKFVWNIYQTLQNEESIHAEIDYNDMLGAMALLNQADMEPIQVVLDPTFAGGGFMFPTMINQEEVENEETGEMELVGGIYVIKLQNNSFDAIKKEIDRIRTNPDIYQEEARVYVIDRSEFKTGENPDINNLKEDDPYFGFLRIDGAEKKEYEKDKVLYVYNPEKLKTLNYLTNFFDIKEDAVVVYQEEEDELEEVEQVEESEVVEEVKPPDYKQSGIKEDLKVVFYAKESN